MHDAAAAPAAAPQRRLLVRKSVALWWLLLPAGLALVALLPRILPEQYLFDAQVIREYIATMDNAGFALGESFPNTAYLYVIAGIGDAHWPAAYLTYGAAWLSVLIALALARDGGRFWLVIPFAIWHTILVVFTGMHSKEVHAIPAMLCLLAIAGERTTWRRIAAMAILIALYSLFFRKYWVVVGALAAAFLTLRGWKLVGLPDGIAMLVAFLGMLVAYHVATGEYLTDWRNILNEGRDLDLFSDTAFANPLAPTSLVADAANALIVAIQLLFPVGMLASAKLQHVAFAGWEVANALAFAWLIGRAWRRPDAPARLLFACAWVIAFTLTQSTFEPDYGSFLRHQTTLLPLLAYIAVEGLWPRARPRADVSAARPDRPRPAAAR